MVPIDKDGKPRPNGEATHLRVHRNEWVKGLTAGAALFVLAFGGASYLFTTSRVHAADVRSIETAAAKLSSQISEHIAVQNANAIHEIEWRKAMAKRNDTQAEATAANHANIIKLMAYDDIPKKARTALPPALLKP